MYLLLADLSCFKLRAVRFTAPFQLDAPMPSPTFAVDDEATVASDMEDGKLLAICSALAGIFSSSRS